MLVYTGFENKHLLFRSPEALISSHSHATLGRSFEAMESWLDKGYYLAGFLSYEAGYGFEDKLSDGKTYGFPLLHMGCYRSPEPAPGFCRNASGSFRVTGVRQSLPFCDYSRDIDRVRAFIAEGDVYQITYCMKMNFEFEGEPRALFSALQRAHPMPYPAFIEDDGFRILSLSPELFMKRSGSAVHTKPMKGTWPRGRNPVSDLAARFRLKNSEKNRAENVMIADLLRNDLGRIGRGVCVDRLFEVTSYKTLYQMTSSISADVDKGLPLRSLFGSLFPSGSVTGAPKLRAMEVIRELEREERKIYTGAIGFVAPDRSFFFTVPIRTLLLEGGRGEMGVGGGIVWDSTSQGEWGESMLKAKFLTDVSR